jgi:hypothetical protein
MGAGALTDPLAAGGADPSPDGTAGDGVPPTAAGEQATAANKTAASSAMTLRAENMNLAPRLLR